MAASDAHMPFTTIALSNHRFETLPFHTIGTSDRGKSWVVTRIVHRQFFGFRLHPLPPNISKTAWELRTGSRNQIGETDERDGYQSVMPNPHDPLEHTPH
jgi:hypothetical protein